MASLKVFAAIRIGLSSNNCVVARFKYLNKAAFSGIMVAGLGSGPVHTMNFTQGPRRNKIVEGVARGVEKVAAPVDLRIKASRLTEENKVLAAALASAQRDLRESAEDIARLGNHIATLTADLDTEKTARKKLEGIVTEDPLIAGVGNKRGFARHLSRSVSDHFRSGAPVSVVMLTLDNVRVSASKKNPEFNKEARREFAERVVQMLIRRSDGLYHLAGDTFALVLMGIDVISGVTQESVIEIVRNKAKEMNCSLDLLGREIGYKILDSGQSGTVFDLKLGKAKYEKIELSAIGEHQVRNSALAVDAMSKLSGRGFEIKEDEIRNALRTINIPGRFEVVGKRPLVILDGAHNVMKVNALVATLRQLYKGKTMRFVFAAKKDKKVAEMLELLSPLALKFYFCKFEATTDFGNKMSISPGDIAGFTSVESEVFDNAVPAYKRALSEAGADDIVCVTGSLYLVGELRTALSGGSIK